VSISGARGVLMNITSGPELTIEEVQEASSLIQQQAHEDANIIWGTVLDETAGEELRVTVIATGIGEVDARAKPDLGIIQGSRRNDDLPPSEQEDSGRSDRAASPHEPEGSPHRRG